MRTPVAVAWLALSGTVIGAAYVLRRRIAVVAVIGPSMVPVLNPGDRVLIARVRGERVRSGQIAVVEHPGDPAWESAPLRWPPDGREWIIKRVAAVAGDPRPAWTAGGNAERIVPEGKIVVLGDNPHRSMDSRQIGYVPVERVLGVVLRRMTARPSGNVAKISRTTYRAGFAVFSQMEVGWTTARRVSGGSCGAGGWTPDLPRKNSPVELGSACGPSAT